MHPTQSPPVMPQGWSSEWSAEHQRYYYVNAASGESSWTLPASPPPNAPPPNVQRKPVAAPTPQYQQPVAQSPAQSYQHNTAPSPQQSQYQQPVAQQPSPGYFPPPAQIQQYQLTPAHTPQPQVNNTPPAQNQPMQQQQLQQSQQHQQQQQFPPPPNHTSYQPRGAQIQQPAPQHQQQYQYPVPAAPGSQYAQVQHQQQNQVQSQYNQAQAPQQQYAPAQQPQQTQFQPPPQHQQQQQSQFQPPPQQYQQQQQPGQFQPPPQYQKHQRESSLLTASKLGLSKLTSASAKYNPFQQPKMNTPSHSNLPTPPYNSHPNSAATTTGYPTQTAQQPYTNAQTPQPSPNAVNPYLNNQYGSDVKNMHGIQTPQPSPAPGNPYLGNQFGANVKQTASHQTPQFNPNIKNGATNTGANKTSTANLKKWGTRAALGLGAIGAIALGVDCMDGGLFDSAAAIPTDGGSGFDAFGGGGGDAIGAGGDVGGGDFGAMSGQEAVDANAAQLAMEQQGRDNALMLLDPVGTEYVTVPDNSLI